MATKKPLVITNGVIEQLQSGDSLDLQNSVTKNNATGNTLTIGTPVYVSGGNAIEAQANAYSTVRVAGLVKDVSAPTGGSVNILSDGVLVATTTQWDAVTGQTGGLTEGADYWLSEITAGSLTTTAPTTSGNLVQLVGHALSDTEMEIEVGQPVRL